MDDTEWRELVFGVMSRYAAEHPGERHTLDEWADLLRDDVCRADMERWYEAHPQYRPMAAAADEQEG